MVYIISHTYLYHNLNLNRYTPVICAHGYRLWIHESIPLWCSLISKVLHLFSLCFHLMWEEITLK